MRDSPADACYMGSAYAQLQWACSIIGAILVTVNPAYKVHELVNPLLADQVTALKLEITDGNVEPRRSFALVPGSNHSNIEISEFVDGSMS